MKKILITLCILMLTTFGFSQTTDNSYFIEAGVNPTTISSEDVNWVAKVGVDITPNAGISVFYERYNTEGYISFGVQPSVGWNINKYFQFSVGTELSIIERFGLFNPGVTTTYATYGFNAEFGLEVLDNVIVYFGGDLKHRPDVSNGVWQISPGTGVRLYVF